jgi:hypothetical protein
VHCLLTYCRGHAPSAAVFIKPCFQDLPCMHAERECPGRACIQGAHMRRALAAGSKQGPECRVSMPGAAGGRCQSVESSWQPQEVWPWPIAGGVRVRGRMTVRVSLCLSVVWSRTCVVAWAGAEVTLSKLKTVAPVLGGASVDHGRMSRGVLNLPAARFLQTKRFDPLPFPPLY